MNTGRVDEVEYFGYGANRSPEMMEAIIGRVPAGYPATVSGFELCVQTWQDIPKEVRETLCPPWDDTFQSYGLCPKKGFRSHPISGMVWKLTRQERKYIDAWEMTGKWYHVFLLQYDNEQHEHIQIEIQVLEDQPVDRVIKSPMYKTFLNDKQKMLTVARNLRRFQS